MTSLSLSLWLSLEERQSERVWGRRCWDFHVKDVRMRITKT
jgi:hypothetical protein